MQGHLNCDSWKKFHNYINFSGWTVTIIHRKTNQWVNEKKKKNTRFPTIIFLNSNENNSPWLQLTWTCQRFTGLETCLLSLATVFFHTAPFIPPLPCCFSRSHPQHSSFTFPTSGFSVWASLWCKHPYYWLAWSCTSIQAQTYFPPSQKYLGSVSCCPMSWTVCVALLGVTRVTACWDRP